MCIRDRYITADYRRMMETPERLVGGMKVVLSLFEHAKGIFGVEDNKPDCIEKLKELTKDEPRMEVMALKTKYPQGGERQLIYATTGRAINSTMLPADAGCVVDNVETMINIYQAVVEGKPSIERDVYKRQHLWLLPVHLVCLLWLQVFQLKLWLQVSHADS